MMYRLTAFGLLFFVGTFSQSAFGFDDLCWLDKSDGRVLAGYGASSVLHNETIILGSSIGSILICPYSLEDTSNIIGASERMFHPDPEPNDPTFFGFSLALHNDTLIVGAPRDDHAGSKDEPDIEDAGSVYIFEYNNITNEWIEVQKIIASEPLEFGLFGNAVDFDGETLVIGQPGPYSSNPGSVHIYTFNEATQSWTVSQTITSSDGRNQDRFGREVAVDGHRLLVGAPYKDSLILPEDFDGGAYLFAFDDGEWEEVLILDRQSRIDDLAERFFYGAAIDLLDNVLLIGAPGSDIDLGKEEGGIAYVYEVDDDNQIVLRNPLLPDDLQSYEFFGREVHIKSKTEIFVGARTVVKGGFDGPGKMYSYTRNEIGFQNETRIDAPDGSPTQGEGFGASIASYDDLLLVGAPQDDENGNNSGAAYLFDLAGGCPATLESVDITFGTLLSGELDDLYLSDDDVIRARSAFGFLSSEPNVLRTRVIARGDKSPAPNGVLFIRVVGRVNNPNSTWTWSLRDQSLGGGGAFQTVHSYMNSGVNETTENITIENADSYINSKTGEIELEIKQTVIATFSLSGFIMELDRVRVGFDSE